MLLNVALKIRYHKTRDGSVRLPGIPRAASSVCWSPRVSTTRQESALTKRASWRRGNMTIVCAFGYCYNRRQCLYARATISPRAASHRIGSTDSTTANRTSLPMGQHKHGIIYESFDRTLANSWNATGGETLSMTYSWLF